ncbi:MAG: hypothetical protein HY645_01800 [Acidobacteria bacterium]|nr:hypothetical protein [Acidobacteriota bacterium]
MDSGNYLKPPGPNADLVNALMMESLSALPLHVLNLAPEDLFYWKTLSQAARRTVIISTNLGPRSKSLPAPAVQTVLEIPGAEMKLSKNIRIGFLGLSSPDSVKPNSGFSALDPDEALDRAKTSLKDRVDFLVLLGAISRGTATKLAIRHPEIRAILLAEKRVIIPTPERVNNAIILPTVDKGQYLGQLSFYFDEGGKIQKVEPDFIELKAGVPENAELLRQQQELSAKLPPGAY